MYVRLLWKKIIFIYKKSYLNNLFNEFYYNGERLLLLFNEQQNMLYDIYFFLLENDKDHQLDYNGKFLGYFIEKDEKNIQRLCKCIFNNAREEDDYDLVRNEIIWQLDNYKKYLDFIIEYALDNKFYLQNVIAIFFDNIENRNINQRKEECLGYLIRKYSNNQNVLFAIFDEISELSYDFRRKAIKEFLKCNKNYEMFKNLPIDRILDFNIGSMITAYQKEIDFFESLMQHLKGIDYLEHKRFINEKINSLKKMIEKEEIKEILNNL